MEYMETKKLKKGTVVHINGLPCYLEQDAKITTHELNWGLIFATVVEEKESTSKVG